MLPQITNLKRVEVLKDIPDNQLQWLVEKGKIHTYQPGEYVFKKNDPIDKMIIVLSGVISLKLSQNGQFREINKVLSGGIMGALPYSRATTSTASGIAEGESHVLILGKENFEEMIRHHHELTTALVHIMTSRVREFTTAQQQDDKMMALGKLSAGLAHELNNPASAVVRSSSKLKEYNQLLPELLSKVISLEISSENIKEVNDLYLTKSLNKSDLTLKNRTELEDSLTDWLEHHNIDNPFEIAEVLSEYNFSVEELNFMNEKVTQQNLSLVLEWIANTLVSRKLVDEINDGSKRISNLVQAIKTYSHMDRSPEKEFINIHEGINSTLTMLGHKIKNNKIQVIREFSEDLPKVNAYTGTLNQVWTNIIDNAIDAMKQGGTLTVKTFQENRDIKIDIIDDGPGIDESIKNKIFDPFYTTKDIGKGTGLGLDIVQKIINQHEGSIKVNSRPGETIFHICLPNK